MYFYSLSLIILHANRLLFGSILYSNLCPVWLYCLFLHYLINSKASRKKKNFMCLSIFSTNLSEIFLIPRRNQQDMIINAHRSSRKISLGSCRISIKFEFCRRFSKNTQILNFMRAEEQTGRHDENKGRFSQCCEKASNFPFSRTEDRAGFL